MAAQFYRLLGQRVREFRKRAEYTLEELAERAELDSQYLGFIERGQGKPSLDALQRIARALGVEIGELFQFQRAGQQEDKDYLTRQLSRLLNPRSPQEIRALRSLVKQIVELLPPAK